MVDNNNEFYYDNNSLYKNNISLYKGKLSESFYYITLESILNNNYIVSIIQLNYLDKFLHRN